MLSIFFEIVGLAALSGLTIFVVLLGFGVWFYYWLFKAISMARKQHNSELVNRRR
jgi:hypothetical protein